MGELFDMSSKIGEDLRARTRLKSDIEQRLREAAEQKRQANVFGYQKNYSPVSDEKGNITSYTPNQKEAKNQYNKIRQYSEGGDLGRMPLLDEKIPVDNFGDSPISTEEMKLFKAKSDAAVAAKNNQGGQINPVHAEIASHVDKTLAMPLVDKSNKGSLLQLMNNVATPKQDGMRVVGKNESGGNILSPEKTKEELPGAEINVPLKPAPPLGFGDLNAMEQIQKTALDPSIQEKMIDLAQLPAEMKAELGLPEQGRIPNQIFNAILGRDAKLKAKKDETISALAQETLQNAQRGVPPDYTKLVNPTKADINAFKEAQNIYENRVSSGRQDKALKMREDEIKGPILQARIIAAKDYQDVLENVASAMKQGVFRPRVALAAAKRFDLTNPIVNPIAKTVFGLTDDEVALVQQVQRADEKHAATIGRGVTKYGLEFIKKLGANLNDPKAFETSVNTINDTINKDILNAVTTAKQMKKGDIAGLTAPKKIEFNKQPVDLSKKENDRQNILGMKDHPNFGSAKRIFESKYGESL